MIELKCKNCNSADLEYKDGLWICNSCGSRYITDKNERPEFQKEAKLEDEICDICEEIASTSEFDEEDFDKRERLFRKLDSVADNLINLNMNNPYAMTAKMLVQIDKGLRDKPGVNRFIEYIERAVDNSDQEAKDNTWDALGDHLIRFRTRILSVDPSLADRIHRLVNVLGYSNS